MSEALTEMLVSLPVGRPASPQRGQKKYYGAVGRKDNNCCVPRPQEHHQLGGGTQRLLRLWHAKSCLPIELHLQNRIFAFSRPPLRSLAFSFRFSFVSACLFQYLLRAFFLPLFFSAEALDCERSLFVPGRVSETTPTT